MKVWEHASSAFPSGFRLWAQQPSSPVGTSGPGGTWGAIGLGLPTPGEPLLKTISQL